MGPGGEPKGLALSTVKDFLGDLYSGEHPRDSSVTDRIGLLFCKDPVAAIPRKMDGMRGLGSSGEAS